MKISDLIDSIRKRDLVVPEFQREFVWTKEKSKQLMVSLVKTYPVGSLLFWKTDKPPELKNIRELPERFGTIQVLLDGQQRLTALYMLIAGEIPPYYTEADIQNDPRDLYFNLDSAEFQYYQASRMRGNPLWWRVVDCFDGDRINIFEIAKRNAATDQEALELAQKYNRNLNSLCAIRNTDLAVQTVPPHSGLSDSIDIFDRANSLGTKLTDAELALTHITGTWGDARRLIKAKLDDLSEQQFRFDLTFMTRALTGVVTKRALFSTIHDQPRGELETGWEKLKHILDYLANVLPGRAFIHSTTDLNTTNVLIPVVVYLSLHDSKFSDERELKHALHWLYAAQIWARYTAQTDQRLEHDVSLIGREERPWNALCDQIIDQRGRIEVKASDLEGRGAQHPLYRMTLILAKCHGAVDWSNGIALGTPRGGKPYSIHSHHIFPQAVLYRSGYDPGNHLHRKIVNEIANRAFLTAGSNLSISAKPPEEYLAEVESRYPSALTAQFIPMDPNLWKVARFRDFLEERRKLISIKTNEFVSALISEPEDVRPRPTSELVVLGESATLEFKSTLQWDLVQNRTNKELRHSVLKTIAAFLNSSGGTLVIGVEDDGQVLGLDNDLKTLQGSVDRFGQLLTSLIGEHIGVHHSASIQIRFENLEGKTVCLIETDKAPEPAFLKGPRGKEFHIRFGNTTRMLDAEETVRYIEMNWE